MLQKIRKTIVSTITIESEKLIFDADLIAEEVLKKVEKEMLPPLLQVETYPDELIFSWENE